MDSWCLHFRRSVSFIDFWTMMINEWSASQKHHTGPLDMQCNLCSSLLFSMGIWWILHSYGEDLHRTFVQIFYIRLSSRWLMFWLILKMLIGIMVCTWFSRIWYIMNKWWISFICLFQCLHEACMFRTLLLQQNRLMMLIIRLLSWKYSFHNLMLSNVMLLIWLFKVWMVTWNRLTTLYKVQLILKRHFYELHCVIIIVYRIKLCCVLLY